MEFDKIKTLRFPIFYLLLNDREFITKLSEVVNLDNYNPLNRNNIIKLLNDNTDAIVGLMVDYANNDEITELYYNIIADYYDKRFSELELDGWLVDRKRGVVFDPNKINSAELYEVNKNLHQNIKKAIKILKE